MHPVFKFTAQSSVSDGDPEYIDISVTNFTRELRSTALVDGLLVEWNGKVVFPKLALKIKTD